MAGGLVLLLGAVGGAAAEDAAVVACRTAVRHGHFEQATTSCTAALSSTRSPTMAVSLGLDLSQAYQGLGLLSRATEVLQKLLRDHGEISPDERATVLGQQAAVALVAGDRGSARLLLDAAWAASPETSSGLLAAQLTMLDADMMLDANAARAMVAYEKTARLASGAPHGAPLEVRALTHAGLAALRAGDPEASARLLTRAGAQTEDQPASHATVYDEIALAVASLRLASAQPASARALMARAASLLRRAGMAAAELGDARGESYAWGWLAELYEGNGRIDDALALVRRAIRAAQSVHQPEALYRWYWQLARLEAASGRVDDAISAYQLAVDTLQAVRAEAAGRSDGVASVDVVRSVYLGHVDLLLKRAAKSSTPDRHRADLVNARRTMEMFRTAELQDYLQDECVNPALLGETSLDKMSAESAIVYPILLPDRLELLTTIAGRLDRVAVPVPREEVNREARAFRETAVQYSNENYRPHARRLYDWLVRPLEEKLRDGAVGTIVFVPSGALLSVPFSALWSGEGFLVERYAIAITPSLGLTDARPLGRRQQIRMVVGGVTEAVQGFSALPGVTAEIEFLADEFDGTVLMNQDFRIERLDSAMSSGPVDVVHIASHASFQEDVNDTFLLAYDEKIDMQQLGDLVGMFRFGEDPLDLLTLSACETARGDDRAALGLAGVAVKAGAKSALATLWSISDDASAELIQTFYRGLRDQDTSKAEALQAAQKKVQGEEAYRHPYFWSAFLIINNWL